MQLCLKLRRKYYSISNTAERIQTHTFPVKYGELMKNFFPPGSATYDVT